MRIWPLLAVAGAVVGLAPAHAAPAARATAPASEPLLHGSSLVYEGAFRLPLAQSAKGTFGYGGTALAYDPARGGLFAVGHD